MTPHDPADWNPDDAVPAPTRPAARPGDAPGTRRPVDPQHPGDPLDLDTEAAATRIAQRPGRADDPEPEATPADDAARAEVGSGPRRGGWLAFGALTALAIATLSGIALSFHYVPTTELAHASLRSLETDLEHGALVRALHWLSSSVAIGLLMVVLLGAFLRADWRHRGAFAWWSGVFVFLVTLAFQVTGELLPWNEQAVFATEVRTGLLAASPGIGATLRDAALGADVVAAPALTRFHALHVAFLPIVLIGLLWRHVRARSRHAPEARRPLGFAHALVGLLVTAAIGYGAMRWRAPLGEMFVAGDIGFDAFPEWNWLWLNKLVKLTPAGLEALPAVVVPGLLLLGMLVVPLLHRDPAARLVKPVLMVPGLLVLAGLGVLSWLNAQERPDNEPTLPMSLTWNDDEREGYALVRGEDCIQCHKVRWNDVVYQGDEDNDQASDYTLDELAEFGTPDEFAEYLRMPEDLDMPPYDHLTLEQRRKIALFVQALERTIWGK